MATIALRAELPIMNVISIMTISARSICFDLACHRTIMALVAIRNIFMRSVQLKAGLVVIKVP
jgi:hypothetical protein